ncbi:MAG: TetR/AcrR family transcriptional regulator [Candidatus Edwardsbacteria bacterium]|nr:TetR/AcrR family transcriptional regulator [Candidatus Edwardsbacteria bacterium]MBU1575624.1 TetR/AcrR family transcriptional regulator [Candidatus Edwardsbacteria bacterium]MBU2462994.1 TetR/AcrR family transcriptional regulator [Candidatus Edwardsbacteria bacterium]MBU2594595.1 TetR/AcrR family transcriptional regulator [Candidatus Edwardsbacteria bacterium]
MPKPQRRKPTETRRKEIVATAQKFMIERGVYAITIKNIAYLNGISEAAVYRHFKSKRDILGAIIDDVEIKMMETFDQAVVRDSDPIKKLKDIMRSHLIFTEKRKGGLFVITSECIHLNDDFLRKKILKVIDNYTSRIGGLLNEARSRGLACPEMGIKEASLMYYGLIQTAATDFTLRSYDVPPISKFEHLWRFFCNGINYCRDAVN